MFIITHSLCLISKKIHQNIKDQASFPAPALNAVRFLLFFIFLCHIYVYYTRSRDRIVKWRESTKRQIGGGNRTHRKNIYQSPHFP